MLRSIVLTMVLAIFSCVISDSSSDRGNGGPKVAFWTGTIAGLVATRVIWTRYRNGYGFPGISGSGRGQSRGPYG